MERPVPLVGTIKLFACLVVPKGWALCDGRVLDASQNVALFSLINRQYTDGSVDHNHFQLPDLRGRVPVHQGGPKTYTMGQTGGAEFVTLRANEIPPHTHAIQIDAEPANSAVPSASALLAQITGPTDVPAPKMYIQTAEAGPLVALSEGKPMIAAPGRSGLPHENRQPFMALHYCIAIEGMYPSRN